MIGLGSLPGWSTGSGAFGVSGGGSIVVGEGFTLTSAEAAIWTESSGLVSLEAVLALQYGVDLTGWSLSRATDISADGRVVVGIGTNPSGFEEGWIATNDEPFMPLAIPEASTGSLVGLGLVILARVVRRSRSLPTSN